MTVKLIAILAFSAVVAAANASIWNFNINATGAQVVPSSTSSGSGVGTMTYNDVTNQFSLDMTMTGISAPGFLDITSTRLYAGPSGSPGSQIDDLSVLCNWFGANGSYSLFSPVQYVLNEQHESALLGGNLFLQVNTVARPNGEIRGQFTPVPEPATLAVLGLGALAALRRRKR